MSVFLPVIRSFNDQGVRYVLVGGLAAVLHGVNRFTADVDFVLALDAMNTGKAVEVLSGLGLRPRAPVDPREFADPVARRRWIDEKGMQVFTFYDPKDPFLAVDLFVDDPIPFPELWDRSVAVPLGATSVRVCALDDLIAMKRKAGRPKDLQDLIVLEAIRRERPT